MAIEEIKILGAFLELPAKQHSRFGQFGPRIFIFSIVLGAECLSYVKFIATYALIIFSISFHSQPVCSTFFLKFHVFSKYSYIYSILSWGFSQVVAYLLTRDQGTSKELFARNKFKTILEENNYVVETKEENVVDPFLHL